MLGRDFHILPANVAARVLVLDANIRKVNLIVEVRELLLPCPFLDLLDRAIGSAVAVAIATIAGLQKPLVLAFQLPIELDAQDARPTRLKPLCCVDVRSIDLRVVRPFARLVRARVERLAVRGVSIAMPLEEVTAPSFVSASARSWPFSETR